MAINLHGYQQTDFLFEIAKGSIPGHFIFNKFGENTSVGTSLETIWDGGGIYSYLSSASQLKISSSTGSDSSAGTGVRTVNIQGLDTDYNFVSEDVTMNGQTAVLTSNTYTRIFRIKATLAGSGGTAAGNIYAGTGDLTGGVPDNIYAQVINGNNQTLMCVFTVPSGYTGYVINRNGGVGTGKDVTLSSVVREFGTNVFNVKGKLIISANAKELKRRIPDPIPEKSDIEIRGITTTGTVAATAQFDIILVKNNNSVQDIF